MSHFVTGSPTDCEICCDCCQTRTVVLPGDGKSVTVTCLDTPVRNSPAGTVTVKTSRPRAAPLTKSCAECVPALTD